MSAVDGDDDNVTMVGGLPSQRPLKNNDTAGYFSAVFVQQNQIFSKRCWDIL